MGLFKHNKNPEDKYMRWLKVREKHYRKFFGPMSEQVMHSTDIKEVHIDIYQFAPNKKRPYWTFITGGMSDEEQNVPYEADWVSPRTEVMAYAKEPYDRIFSVLKLIAEMSFEENSFMHWYHTISVGEPVTKAQSELTCAFLTPPFFEKPKFDTLHLDGEKVDFLFMVPVTVQERKYAIDKGGEALLKVFEDANLNPVPNENRTSLV